MYYEFGLVVERVEGKMAAGLKWTGVVQQFRLGFSDELDVIGDGAIRKQAREVAYTGIEVRLREFTEDIGLVRNMIRY